MKTFFFSIFLLLNIVVYGQTDIKNFYYLQGDWSIVEKDKTTHEQWKIENDSLLTAVSFYVKESGPSAAETVRLEKSGDDIFYIANVPGNEAPVAFKLTSFVNNKAVFENPEHDFPTKVIYEKISNDELHARIEGMINGELKGIDYPFKRVK